MIIDRQKFSEFYSTINLETFRSESIISFTQPITGNDYNNIIKKLIRISAASFYWNLPYKKFSFFAFDEILTLTNSDLEINETILKNPLTKVITNLGSGQEIIQPLFVGGEKFPSSLNDGTWEDFNSSKWFVPKILLLNLKEQFYLTYNFMLDANAADKSLDEIDRLLAFDKYNDEILNERNTISAHDINEGSDFNLWSDQVESALKKISTGEIKKVVLARYKDLEFSEFPNILDQLKKLEDSFPNCYIFAFRQGRSIFFGASPEKLFNVSKGFLETDALAGSIPRGKTTEEDKLLEAELLHSEKNLAEHKSVVDFLLNRLTPLSEKILFDTQPTIKKFQNIQHIYSQIQAKLKEETTIFSLLQKLHPTPAVCGTPQNSALATINQIEKFDRGMYAGILGWFNLQNKGDFMVGIRSAILKGKFLRAFAGCGIVDGSESYSEYNETELKLKSILSLFENETISKS